MLLYTEILKFFKANQVIPKCIRIRIKKSTTICLVYQ